jgi:membrane-associated phospholipid phosphatase
VGRAPGAIGWTYAAALGFALVYLGEHYVTDLVAGLALTEGVRRAAILMGAVEARR